MTLSSEAPWRSRIVGQGEEDPHALKANPKNWRSHPPEQQAALGAMLDEVGWVQQVIVNRQTGLLVDGHLRVDLALARGEEAVPVVYVDLTEEEEATVLATLDPLAAMAAADRDRLATLLGEIDQGRDARLSALWATLQAAAAPPLERLPAGVPLAETFLVPPFSVLDARQGYWQDRKREWLALGLQSDLGAGRSVIYGVEMRKDPSGRLMAASHANRLSVLPPSSFDPVLCELAYRWFCPTGGTVFDPFCGGTVAGMVAGYLGHPFTGWDLSEEQVAVNRAQLEESPNRPPPVTPVWEVRDSAADENELEPESIDLAITSPPYFDLERYNEAPGNLANLSWEDFLAAHEKIIAKVARALKPNRFAIWQVADVRQPNGNYRGILSHTERAFAAAGMPLYNEAIMVYAVGSLPLRAGRQFKIGRKLGRTHQSILVFVKGDWRKATAACGDVQIPRQLQDEYGEALD